MPSAQRTDAVGGRAPGAYTGPVSEKGPGATAGGLISFGPSIPETTRHSAVFIDRILKGSKAGDVSIEQPTKFELVINMKTAKALGLTIPPSMLARADEVIQ